MRIYLMKFKILFVIIFAAFGSRLFAESPSPYQFLRNISSARAAGIAGCFEAMPNDASAMYFNPAAISTVEDKKFSATFFKHILDINSGLASYVFETESNGVFAASAVYTNYGSFTYADEYGNLGSEFGANDIALAASYSNELDTNLYYGATLKFLYVGIEKQASTAIAIDAGLIYRMPEQRTNLGISVLHAGSQLSKFGDDSEGLPLDVRIGGNHRLEGLPLLFNLSFRHLADETDSFFQKFESFALGGEIYLGDYVRARIGYDNKVRTTTTVSSDRKLSGFSGGVGIESENFNFDYGVSLVGSNAYYHRFGLALDF